MAPAVAPVVAAAVAAVEGVAAADAAVGAGAAARAGTAIQWPVCQLGNRRRSAQPLTGSIAITAQNSALNAAPFSLNGQPSQKAYSASKRAERQYRGAFGNPENRELAAGAVYRHLRHQSEPQRKEHGGICADGGGTGRRFFGAGVRDLRPAERRAVSGNAIPSDRFNSNPAVIGLLKYFPAPVYSQIVQNYRFVITDPSTGKNIGVRFNAPVSDQDRLNFNVQRQWRDSNSHQLFGFLDTSSSTGLSFSSGWSHSFAARLNNSATVSFSRSVSLGTPFFAYGADIAADLGITGTARIPAAYGPPSLSFTNFSGLSDGSPTSSHNQTVTAGDTFTYVANANITSRSASPSTGCSRTV